MKSLLYLNLYFILFILHIFQLSAQETDTELLLVECEIVKIDSVGNHYVIYAKDSLEKYKIVSEKDSSVCQNIIVGLSYKIVLDPPLPQPMNLNPVTFPGGAVIIPYGWGKTLYFALNIKGLCYNNEFKDDILKKRKEIEEQEPLKFKNKRAERKWYDKLLKKEMKKIESERYYETDHLKFKNKKAEKKWFDKLIKEEMKKRGSDRYYETDPLIE